jgi:hypothetical protein
LKAFGRGEMWKGYLRKLMLMRIPNYQVHAGQGPDLLGYTLRVAPGDHDARVRILAAHSADRSTGVLIRCGGDCAGIEDNHGSLRGAGSAGESTLFELPFHRGAIGLRRAASKIFYIESGHTLW